MKPLRRALLLTAIGGGAAAAGYALNAWRMGTLGSSSSQDAAAAILASPFLTLEGQSQTLTRWRGQILIINYWATWCAPCREEIPMFVRLQQEYLAQGVQFVGIAIDQPDKVRDFAQTFKINYPLLMAGIEGVELSRRAGNKAGVLPYTLVLDRSGKIAASLVGNLPENRMRAAIEPLL